MTSITAVSYNFFTNILKKHDGKINSDFYSRALFTLIFDYLLFT